MAALPLPEAPHHQLIVLALGIPAPQGSKRAVAPGVVIDDNRPALRNWRDDVKMAALRAMAESPGWHGASHSAVTLYATFCLPRPRSHFRVVRGSDAPALKTWAPARHTGRPDLDKLLRSTMDALTAAGAYPDDSRVSGIFAQKLYTSSENNLPGVMEEPGARLILLRTDP